MHPTAPNPHARRAFLRRAGQLAFAGAATPFGLNLAAFGDAAAFTGTDYRALVCVFLYGGNDYANTLIPYDDASYNAYQAQRPDLAIARNMLAATRLACDCGTGDDCGFTTAGHSHGQTSGRASLGSAANSACGSSGVERVWRKHGARLGRGNTPGAEPNRSENSLGIANDTGVE